MDSDRRAIVVLAVLITALAAGSAKAQVTTTTFDVNARSEAVATVTANCERCSWDIVGREAVILSVTLDGRYIQHVPLVRAGRADYHVMLGSVETGRHTVALALDRELTATDLRASSPALDVKIDIELVGADASQATPLSYAPFFYARADTVGKYTDVPVFMWYEIEPTSRGTRYRYSVIFTNEDGGTPADRLMATWGRTTDIEYVYSVELDASGKILAEDIQGPRHEILDFKGRREGRHPLLWVSTSNNMVLPEGSTRVRYAPAPVFFQLRDVSREAVMDAHPWMYGVMAKELAREGKIAADPPAGQGMIPDVRRFVVIEGCGVLADYALAFAVEVGGQWISSDRGLKEFRIARNGCFRSAVPLPSGTGISDVRALRAQVFSRDDKKNPAPATLTRINALFALNDQFMPEPSILTWKGNAELRPEQTGLEIRVSR